MQTIIIKIEIGNAAFEENGGSEVACILRHLADRYGEEGFYLYRKLRDSNGNIVGSADLQESGK